MSEQCIKAVIRWDLPEYTGWGEESVVKIMDHICQVEYYEEVGVSYRYKRDIGNYHPTRIEDNYYLDYTLEDDYPYNVETVIVSLEDIQEHHNTLLRDTKLIIKNPRVIFCNSHNGCDCPLDVEGI